MRQGKTDQYDDMFKGMFGRGQREQEHRNQEMNLKQEKLKKDQDKVALSRKKIEVERKELELRELQVETKLIELKAKQKRVKLFTFLATPPAVPPARTADSLRVARGSSCRRDRR